MIPRDEFRDGRRGASIATGRPRFVTTIDTPVADTESMRLRIAVRALESCVIADSR